MSSWTQGLQWNPHPAARCSKSASWCTQIYSKCWATDAANTLKIGGHVGFGDQQPATIANVIFNEKPFAVASDKNRERWMSNGVPACLQSEWTQIRDTQLKCKQTCNCMASAGQSRHMSGEMQGLLQSRCPHSKSCEFIRWEGLNKRARTRATSSDDSGVPIVSQTILLINMKT